MQTIGNFGQTMISGLQYDVNMGNYAGGIGSNAAPTYNSEPVKCDGLVQRSNGVHTIQIKTIAFSGNIQFYGTLEQDPGTANFVPIYPQPISANVGATLNYANVSTNTFWTITGKFTWMQCVVNNITQGAIEYIRVTY